MAVDCRKRAAVLAHLAGESLLVLLMLLETSAPAAARSLNQALPDGNALSNVVSKQPYTIAQGAGE